MRILTIIFFLFLGFLICCTNTEPSSATDNIPVQTLVKAHCGRCHSLPSPTDLDRKTWEQYVLPRMGYFLGIYDKEYSREDLIEKESPAVLERNIFPNEAIIKPEEWELIVQYYLDNAPDKLPYDRLVSFDQQNIFTPQFPNLFTSPPGSILTQFSDKQGLFIGDINKEKLLWLDQKQQLLAAIETPGGAVDMAEVEDGLLVLTMGGFSPSDQAKGQLISYSFNQSTPKVLINSLQRPVHFSQHDLNGDGLQDFVIAEFAKWTGRLAWWEQLENGRYQAHDLRLQSGATRIEIADMNQDGLPDIVALFGQGDEGIWLFLNEGNGKFREENLIRFPPSYGSSYFQLVDWNEDNAPDILYTNGDNADYPPILKPYHGIRLFINEASALKEALFLPLAGAYKAAIHDYDLDGDKDIVAISFFPDFTRQTQQSLVLYEQLNEQNWALRSFAQAGLGRWISMDSKDWDQDGDQDILLGSLAFEVIPDNGEVDFWVKNGLGWVVLNNQSK